MRELKRQIASLYYGRSELSTDKARLAARTQESAVPPAPTFPIRDPYVFEFLGLKPQEVMGESQLEDQFWTTCKPSCSNWAMASASRRGKNAS